MKALTQSVGDTLVDVRSSEKNRIFSGMALRFSEWLISSGPDAERYFLSQTRQVF